MVYERKRGEDVLSDDPERLDVERIHRFLSEQSYWVPGIPREVVERSIAHSLNFGLYRRGVQFGYARVVTDRATFAYLGDVYVEEEARGDGLGKWMVEGVHGHPDLQGLRRWLLVTKDAHGLYRQFGYAELAGPERYMERRVLERYGIEPDPGDGAAGSC